MATASAPPFAIASLGHVVLRVRDVERSEPFYRDVLGLQVRRKRPGRAVFFTCGQQDHDLAIFALGLDAPPPEERRVGMYHVALRVEDEAALKVGYRRFLENDVHIVGINHHGHSKSIYIKDPDGIEIEVYCEADEPAGTEATLRAKLEGS